MSDGRRGPSWKATGMALVMLCLVIMACVAINRRLTYQAHTVWCGNSQRELVSACLAYAQHAGGSWPSPWPDPAAFPRPLPHDAHAARVIAVRCLETLAQVCSISNPGFVCPCSPMPPPHTLPDGEKDITGAWGIGPAHAVSFAFDWSLSGTLPATRIVCADRDPSNHYGKPNVCFGDSHVQAIRFSPVITRTIAFPESIRTEGSDGKPVVVGGAMADDEAANGGIGDIYEADPVHLTEQVTPAGGTATRTWVK